MDVNENNYISPEEDIKQIAKNLLIESKTSSDTLLVYSYSDTANDGVNIHYKHPDSIPLMQDMELLEITLPIQKSSYPRNKFDGDTAIIENDVYEVKINPHRLAKFIQNPDIELFLKKKSVPTIYKAENLIIRNGKLSIIKNTDNTVFLYYEGLNPSKTFSKNRPWYKVFYEFVENKRLEKKDILAIWNTAEKGKYKSTKKTRNDTTYVSKIKQLVLAGLKRASPEIAKHVKIEKGSGYFKSSYTLEID